VEAQAVQQVFYDVFNASTQPVDLASVTVSVTGAVGAHTLTTPEIPSHTHTFNAQ